MTSDIPNKFYNQQINDHIKVETQSLQIDPEVPHHYSFVSNVIVSLTSDDPNDGKITNSVEPVCPHPSRQNRVTLGDAICDAHDTDDTDNIKNSIQYENALYKKSINRPILQNINCYKEYKLLLNI